MQYSRLSPHSAIMFKSSRVALLLVGCVVGVCALVTLVECAAFYDGENLGTRHYLPKGRHPADCGCDLCDALGSACNLDHKFDFDLNPRHDAFSVSEYGRPCCGHCGGTCGGRGLCYNSPCSRCAQLNY